MATIAELFDVIGQYAVFILSQSRYSWDISLLIRSVCKLQYIPFLLEQLVLYRATWTRFTVLSLRKQIASVVFLWFLFLSLHFQRYVKVMFA